MPRISRNRRWLAGCAACAAVLTGTALAAVTATSSDASPVVAAHAGGLRTTTPIKHVIVIFGENISFDHYFGTYPYATNPRGEPPFHKLDDTPRADNLLAAGLLDQNPNSTQPFRMDTGKASVTCDQNHSYTPQQKAVDKGLMDKFPEMVGSGSSATSPCNDYGKGVG